MALNIFLIKTKTSLIPMKKKIEEISHYLSKRGYNLKELAKFNKGLNPMLKNCIAAAVVPALNEESNIENFLKSILNQQFSTRKNLKPSFFEVIIVVNNTTDKTAELARKFIANYNPRTPIYIIEKTFSDNKIGSAYPRKLGLDLVLYRLLEKNERFKKNINNPFYLIMLDADNVVQPKHFKQVIETFKKTNADALIGGYSFFGHPLMRGLDRLPILRKTPNLRKAAKIFRVLKMKYRGKLFFASGNGALTAISYASVGGFPTKKVSADVLLGERLHHAGYLIKPLDSFIEANPRRFLANPFGFITGEAYLETTFLDTNIRKGYQINKIPDIDRKTLDISVNTFISVLASIKADKQNISFKKALKDIKIELKKLFIEEEINYQFNSQYQIIPGRYIKKYIKNWSFIKSPKLKNLKRFKNILLKLLNICREDNNWFLWVDLGEILNKKLFSERKVSLSVFEDYLPELLKNLAKAGFQPYNFKTNIIKIKKKNHKKRLIQAESHENLGISKDELLSIKIRLIKRYNLKVS